MKKFIVLILFLPMICLGQWIQQETNPHPVPLKDIYFIDENNGWAVGGLKYSPEPTAPALYTNNGGYNWDETQIDEVCYSVFFTDLSNGWIGGRVNEFGNVWYTKNGNTGVNADWESINISTPYAVQSLFFIDSLTGWALLSGCPWHCGSYIYKTSDGGETWESYFHDGDEYMELIDFCFINSNRAWAVGDRHVGPTTETIIYNTIDGWESWEAKFVDTGEDRISLNAISFPDSAIGWAVGDKGIMLKTINGGETWEPQMNEAEETLRDVFFIDSLNGWIVGDNGTILFTKDAGENWKTQESGTTEDLWSVYFIEQLVGWTCGSNYTILHTTNGGVGISEALVSTRVSVFPNPFSSANTFEYELNHPSETILSIYNHLGELIFQVREFQQPGKQQIKWNAEGMPAGVYFFRLEVGEQIATGKLVLIN